MKKLMLLLAIMFGMATAHAQFRLPKYQPLLEEGKVWVNKQFVVDMYADQVHEFIFRITLKGDTLVNGRTYKKCFSIPDLSEDRWQNMYFRWSATEPVAYLHEEDMKVYVIFDNRYFDPLPRCDYPLVNYPNSEDKDYLLYDFAKYRNEAIANQVQPEMVKIEGTLRCCFTEGDKRYNAKIVESIGGVGAEGEDLNRWGSLLYPTWIEGTGFVEPVITLSHVLNANGEIIYKSPNYWEPAAVNDVTVTKPADNNYYNLMGQPVGHPEDAPGIYIHEGKKVVVK